MIELLESIAWVILLVGGFGVGDFLRLPAWTLPVAALPAFGFMAWRTKVGRSRVIAGLVLFALCGVAIFVIDDLLAVRIQGTTYWIISMAAILFGIGSLLDKVLAEDRQICNSLRRKSDAGSTY